MKLNSDFRQLLTEQMAAEEVERLIEALATAPQPTSIRRNPLKPYTSPEGRAVSWCAEGCYLAERPSFTRDGHFQAGAYYVQEASSMFVGYLLREALGGTVEEGIRLLDMCAAPGGKSTLYSAMVGLRGVVVANEVIRSRALTLADNITRWGVGNTVVTSNDPSHFASSLEGWFDVVSVDVPCSGEGMFRKSEEARDNWSLDNVNLCVTRSRRIIADAWKALKEGGVMIFSTCTFNRRENEEQMEWLAEEFDCQHIDITCPEEWGITRTKAGEAECFHFYPHKIEGEGLFAAIVRKGGEGSRRKAPKARKSPFAEVDKKVARELAGYLTEDTSWHFATIGESIYAYPENLWADMRTVCEQMSVLFSGVKVGEMFGKKFKPDHSLALSAWLRKEAFATTELTEEDLLHFLRREELSSPTALHEGLNLLLWEGQPVGFTKRIGARTNSLLPKEWRIFM